MDTVARIQLDTLNKWFNLVWQSITKSYNFGKSCQPYSPLILPINYYDTVRYESRSETMSISTKVAKSLGLKVTGVLGILLRAKQEGNLSSLTEVIDELVAKAGFRIALLLLAKVLEG